MCVYVREREKPGSDTSRKLFASAVMPTLSSQVTLTRRRSVLRCSFSGHVGWRVCVCVCARAAHTAPLDSITMIFILKHRVLCLYKLPFVLYIPFSLPVCLSVCVSLSHTMCVFILRLCGNVPLCIFFLGISMCGFSFLIGYWSYCCVSPNIFVVNVCQRLTLGMACQRKTLVVLHCQD